MTVWDFMMWRCFVALRLLIELKCLHWSLSCFRGFELIKPATFVGDFVKCRSGRRMRTADGGCGQRTADGGRRTADGGRRMRTADKTNDKNKNNL